jgi:Helicase conserved C-terminal domain
MNPLRFDTYLPSVRADHLKAMVHLWGGTSQMRKDECLVLILRGLNDPNRVRGAVAGLKPYERNALALAKQMGNAVEPLALGIALRATGVSLPTSRYASHNTTHDMIETLIRRGLFLNTYSRDPGYLSTTFGATNLLFSDERLLMDIGAPEIQLLDLKPTSPPPASTYRRAQTVTLDLIGILQMIQDLGGLELTQAGTLRVNDVRRLIRRLGWRAEEFVVDGLPFPDPTTAFAGALRYSGLLTMRGSTLVLAEPIERFATRPYADQIRTLLRGFIAAHEWQEGQTRQVYDAYPTHRVQGRWALSVTLAALPLAPPAFFALDDLDLALFTRIGEYFTLDYPLQPEYYFQKSPEQIRQAEANRRAKRRADWQQREKPWFVRALATWLYYLGVVELGMANGKPISVRLTDLGRALLHPELDAPRVATVSTSVWVVQPNFDIVVYLDRVTPPQLAFLERHAERVQAQQHTAHYRLTRESVYRGLESGTALEDLIAKLQDGARVSLPSNIITEIREWSALRDKIAVRRRAALLEFEDTDARQAALDAGLVGEPVGERFVLFQGKLDALKPSETVDYAQPLEACLTLTEKGGVRFKHPARDVLIEAQLTKWAERTKDEQWQFTAASVRSAANAGGRVGDLLMLLQARLTHALPPLVGVALRAWAGEALPVELADVIVLRCRRPEVFAALTQSAKFKPYWRGQLAPDVLVVDTEKLADLQEALAWVGLPISAILLAED